MMKQTQAEANYRRGSPVESCGNCRFYQGHHRCSRVLGDVTPYGISNVFKAEKNPFGKRLTAADVEQIKGMMRQREPNDVM